MEKINLETMLLELYNSVVNNKPPNKYYWKYEDQYKEITEVDLLRDRFKTIDDDFNYYEFELENSNLYREKVE